MRVQSGDLVLLNAARHCLFLEIQAIPPCSLTLSHWGSASCVRWKALQFTQREGTGFPGALSPEDGYIIYSIFPCVGRPIRLLRWNKILFQQSWKRASRWLKFTHTPHSTTCIYIFWEMQHNATSEKETQAWAGKEKKWDGKHFSWAKFSFRPFSSICSFSSKMGLKIQTFVLVLEQRVFYI